MLVYVVVWLDGGVNAGWIHVDVGWIDSWFSYISSIIIGSTIIIIVRLNSADPS